MCTPTTVRRTRASLALRASCTLVLAVTAACTTAPSAAPAQVGLPLAEVRVAEPAHASATLPVPALPGAAPPSRWAASERPIGWEAQLAERVDEIERAGGSLGARPSAIGGGPAE